MSQKEKWIEIALFLLALSMVSGPGVATFLVSYGFSPERSFFCGLGVTTLFFGVFCLAARKI